MDDLFFFILVFPYRRFTMKRLSHLTLAFAILSVVFFLLLIFFRNPFPPYPLLSYQDVLDILTPLVLIPIYWLLFKSTVEEKSSRAEEIVFLVLASIWVLGHGMHLAANSVNNLAEALAKKQVVDIISTDIYKLTYFMDEHLSHYLWHVGVVGMAVLLVYRDWRRSTETATTWWVAILSGFLYGFTLFCIFLEGQTVPLGLPFVMIFVLLTLIGCRQKLAVKPVLAFFLIACLVALLFLAGWGIYFGGFPQFSDVGLI
jgi:hypothetical protein